MSPESLGPGFFANLIFTDGGGQKSGEAAGGEVCTHGKHARISAVQTQNKHLEQKFSRLNDKIRMLDELDSLIAEFEDCYDTYHEMRDEVAILSEQADELFQVAPFNFSHKKRQELPKS